MTKWRKKPVVIEAEQLTWDNVKAVLELLGDPGSPFLGDPNMITTEEDKPLSLSIDTLEGTMMAKEGDYIIRGIENELYPCKESIFLKTYEKFEKDSDEPSYRGYLLPSAPQIL